MGTRLVRVRDEDFELIGQLSGLGAHMPFSAKVHALVCRLRTGGDMDAFRLVLREELLRFACGVN